MIITRIYQKICCIHGLRVYEKVGHTMITWMRKKRKIAVQAYYGMCSFMDSNVGKLLSELKQCDIYDDTTIIYASDHGESLGNRGLWGKMTMYEDSASIPLIIKGPTLKKIRCVKHL